MVARHPVLRTGFLWQAGLGPSAANRVTNRSRFPWFILDWRGLDQLDSRIAAYVEKELKREFDFLAPPLVRLVLIRVADDRYQLIWTRHHILLDGMGGIPAYQRVAALLRRANASRREAGLRLLRTVARAAGRAGNEALLAG